VVPRGSRFFRDERPRQIRQRLVEPPAPRGPISFGELDNTVVTAARFFVERRQQIAAGIQRGHQQLQVCATVLKMSSAWSPSAEIASDNLITVSARGIPPGRAGCPPRN